MPNFDYLFDLCKKNAELLSEPFASGPAVSCTRTFTILPLRYAAVGGTSGETKLLPGLPEHLCQPHKVRAFAQASAYFSWLSKRTSNAAQRMIFLSLTKWSTRLAINEAARLLLSRMSWISGAVVLLATVVIFIISEDDLEKWCDRCCFSLHKKIKHYALDDEELGALFNSIEGVV